jgi:methylated-DNA-[protein]-cysteine S-methyltransferase
MVSKEFESNCYEILKKVPFGKVTTYKEIAKALGSKGYRAVGNAMNKNTSSFLSGGNVPCHRVVRSDGKVGGFAFGQNKKIKMLKEEGIKIEKRKINLNKYLYNFINMRGWSKEIFV